MEERSRGRRKRGKPSEGKTEKTPKRERKGKSGICRWPFLYSNEKKRKVHQRPLGKKRGTRITKTCATDETVSD